MPRMPWASGWVAILTTSTGADLLTGMGSISIKYAPRFEPRLQPLPLVAKTFRSQIIAHNGLAGIARNPPLPGNARHAGGTRPPPEAPFLRNLSLRVTAAQDTLTNLGWRFDDMAKLVFGMNQSLDGFVDHDKFAPDPVLFRHWIEHVRGVAGSVYGRRMYEVMRYWDEDYSEWTPELREFATAWRRQPKWVVSRTLESIGPNATLVEGD